MELKVSIEESMNRPLHFRKSVSDTQQANKYTRNDSDRTKKINRIIQNLTFYPQFSESETGTSKSSPSQGSNVGGVNVPTTLNKDHRGEEDLYTDFEGQKKDGTEEQDLVNQVRYIDKSDKAAQSEEGPQRCLEGKDQDKASATLNILETQADEVTSVSESLITAVEVVPDMEKYEICESQNNLVTKLYDEQKDQGPSEPYQDMATKPPSAKTMAKVVYGKSTADTKEKNIPIADHDMSDQYLGADDLAAGGPLEHEEFMTFGTQEVTGKEETSEMPKKKMKKLSEGSLGGTNKHEGLEKMTEEKSKSRVSSGQPNRRLKKAEVPFTYDNLKDKNKQATPEQHQKKNNKGDEEVGKSKKCPNQFGLIWLRCLVVFSHLLSKIPMAQGHPTGTSLESTGVSSSDLLIKPVTGSAGEWHVYLFYIEEGLSGKNLSIIKGIWDICDLSGDRSSCNFTCDKESEVFRLSNNRIALVTRCTDNGLYLECGGNSTLPSYNRTFSDRENAVKYALSKVTPNPKTTETLNPKTTGTLNPKTTGTLNPKTTGTPNPNDTTPGANNAWHIWGTYAVLIIPVVVKCIIFPFVIFLIKQWDFLCRCKNKCQSTKRSSSPEEGEELNAVQVANGTPNGINGHAAQNGISSESPVLGGLNTIHDDRQL